MEGNLRFKIGWDSLIVGRKFTVFALFYFVFKGGLYLEGLIFGILRCSYIPASFIYKRSFYLRHCVIINK